MTMVGLHVKETSAVIVTDTLQYTQDVSRIGHVTKSMQLPHIDAAVATQGSSEFGNYVKLMFLSMSGHWAGFDEAIEGAPEGLLRIWTEVLDDEDRDLDGSVFIVGHSPKAGRFLGFRFDSENGFRADPIVDGLTLYPMPYVYRPSSIEAERMRVSFVESFGAEDANKIVDEWLGMDPLPAPDGIDGWRRLAKDVRQTRALQMFGRVLVAGKVIHTLLRVGSQTSTVIHRYDDDGPEFLRLIEGTKHPRVIETPCECGSGKAIKDCHIVEWEAMIAHAVHPD